MKPIEHPAEMGQKYIMKNHNRPFNPISAAERLFVRG